MLICSLDNAKIVKIDKILFEKIENKIIELGQDFDKDNFETIKKNLIEPPILTAADFAFEVIYVILAGGFSQKTAKKVFAKICAFIKERDKVFGEELFELFHNVNKTNAIAKIWNERQNYREKFYSLKTDDEKFAFLETLPHIGKITKNHIARNLGISVVKYDIWIQRLGISLFGSGETAKFPLDENVKKYCDKMFENLQKETKLPVGFLDAVLWKACQIGLFSFSD
ncbi:MAG: hypothetical protein FWF51_02245 [Chitinivibrionia bacterium]|nr:hypothetical protein [Chitinivibrionia bacterium]